MPVRQQMAVHREIRELASRHPDQTPMYPGKWLFTWVKVNRFMPWMLHSIDPLDGD
jgi:hypothetical protein